MIISICSTYLCRKGDIDEALCMAGFFMGLIEIGMEIGFIAAMTGK
ncbi:hypothetical protein [Enterobacter cloacae complex sp. 2024EL-00215]